MCEKGKLWFSHLCLILYCYDVVLELSLTTLPFSPLSPLTPPSLSPYLSPSSPPLSQGERAQLLPIFHSSVVQCLERATGPSPQSAFFEEALVACHLLMSTSEEGTSSQSLILHSLIRNVPLSSFFLRCPSSSVVVVGRFRSFHLSQTYLQRLTRV